ncbi:MAG: redoxin domain-containing protein [Holophagales bacterium]|nr:redoxin domain-containing protein [Holophagales bacterium]
MLGRRAEIEALGAAVLLVAYDEPSLLEAKMLHHLELPFPLALDRERTAYATWGLGRTNLFGAMLSPSLNWRYFRLLLAGERFLGFAPDMFQLGGDFVVDPKGDVAFAYRMRNNGDRASVATLFEALAGCGAPS